MNVVYHGHIVGILIMGGFEDLSFADFISGSMDIGRHPSALVDW